MISPVTTTPEAHDAEALLAQLAAREQRIELLEDEVRWLKSQLFGRSSEKTPPADIIQYFRDPDVARANMAAGAASAASGGLMNGIVGSFLRRGGSFVARTHNLRVQAQGGAAGVGVDAAISAFPGMTPIQADCN